MPVRKGSYVNDIHGYQSECFVYRDGKELQIIAANLVKEMLENGLKPEDMAILSIHRTETNPLHEITTIAGVPMSRKHKPH